MESCGPSSALSSLKRHVERDSSLYQDRLRPFYGPSVSFRTLHTSGRDEYSEWNSQSGFENSLSIHRPPLLPHAPSSWVTDFERMDIGRLKGKERPLWMDEFHMNTAMNDKQILDCHSLNTRMHSHDVVVNCPMQMANRSSLNTNHLSIEDENALFEAAFSQFSNSLGPDSREGNQDNAEIHAETDALAKTAGQLLDSVNHDTSEKFQNSAFFGLMRRIRDKEVVVEGDKMVERIERI